MLKDPSQEIVSEHYDSIIPVSRMYRYFRVLLAFVYHKTKNIYIYIYIYIYISLLNLVMPKRSTMEIIYVHA